MIWSKTDSRQAALGLALGGGSAETLTRKDRRLLVTSLSVESEARVRQGVHRAWGLCALSIQRLEGSRPAADAGPMQIEWSEGPALRCVGTVRRSTADDTTCLEAGYCRKMLRRECVKKAEEEICSAIRQQGTERAETRERFELKKVVSWLSGDHRWRTKLHVGSR
jgi:hypothetical protein